MSWWTNIRDAAESVVSTVSPIDIRSQSARKQKSGITGAANRARNAEEGFFNKITGRPSQAELRDQQYAMNDQIKAYKEATELSQKELAATQAEKDVEKRRINEKQIRALRNSYRPSGGFLNNQNAGSLGSGNELTNKLGT